MATDHKTGTYTGNGVGNRNIDIGVDLLSKSNVCVIIKGAVAEAGVFRIEYGQGNLSMKFGKAVDIVGAIKTWTVTGFQLGAVAEVNSNGVVYRYIAFWTET